MSHLASIVADVRPDERALDDEMPCTYFGARDGGLYRPLSDEPISALERTAHDAFVAFVGAPGYSCLGARAAVNAQTYRMGVHATLGDPRATRDLVRDLTAFHRERPLFETSFATYVAIFANGASGSAAFERALWRQLQDVHDADGAPWDARVSDDPSSPRFSYSVAGTAYFIVGLHPHAERLARRFAWPTLVFNAHDQFEGLRADGRYGPLRDTIRRRELAAQGGLNPNLAEHGTASEARQYSGRPVAADWTCPFVP